MENNRYQSMSSIVQKLWGSSLLLILGKFIRIRSHAFLLILIAIESASVVTSSAQTNSAVLTLDKETKELVRDISREISQSNEIPVKLDDETRKILRETVQEKWFKKDAFFSTVLGGLLAALAGFGASWYSDRLQSDQKKRENAEFRANVLSAIRREIEVLNEIYDEGMGAMFAKVKEGQVLEARLALTQDWFTVFTANTANLGRFETDVSRQIITVYALLKSLIENFKINNEYITLLEQIDLQLLLGAGEKQQAHLNAKKTTVQSWMVFQATRIRKIETALKTAVSDLFELFDKCGIK